MMPMPSLSRRQLVLAGAGACVSALTQAAPVLLPTTDSLAQSLARALAQASPLVVMVSLEGCPFCRIVRENYLHPLREQQGLAMVQVDMRNRLGIQDFSGASVTQDQLIRQWGIKVAPSLLFFGPGGVEIAPRLMGASIPDFYGAYLDERLTTARLAMTPTR